jgi:hypothetical protein
MSFSKTGSHFCWTCLNVTFRRALTAGPFAVAFNEPSPSRVQFWLIKHEGSRSFWSLRKKVGSQYVFLRCRKSSRTERMRRKHWPWQRTPFASSLTIWSRAANQYHDQPRLAFGRSPSRLPHNGPAATAKGKRRNPRSGARGVRDGAHLRQPLPAHSPEQSEPESYGSSSCQGPQARYIARNHRASRTDRAGVHRIAAGQGLGARRGRNTHAPTPA